MSPLSLSVRVSRSVCPNSYRSIGCPGSAGRNEPFLRLYRNLLCLAGMVYTLGACASVDGMQQSLGTSFEEGVPLLKTLMEEISGALTDGVIPVVCRQAANCLKRALDAWTLPEHTAGARAYAMLIAAQIATLAQSAESAQQAQLAQLQGMFQVAMETAAADEGGYGEDVNVWYRDQNTLECPFEDAIPWNFLGAAV